jgi:hypothetical protein
MEGKREREVHTYMEGKREREVHTYMEGKRERERGRERARERKGESEREKESGADVVSYKQTLSTSFVLFWRIFNWSPVHENLEECPRTWPCIQQGPGSLTVPSASLYPSNHNGDALSLHDV